MNVTCVVSLAFFIYRYDFYLFYNTVIALIGGTTYNRGVREFWAPHIRD
jgi:hypothetical protein